MKLAEFAQTIYTLFSRDTLDRFPDEWGLTTRGREPVTRLGYATNLTTETPSPRARPTWTCSSPTMTPGRSSSA